MCVCVCVCVGVGVCMMIEGKALIWDLNIHPCLCYVHMLCVAFHRKGLGFFTVSHYTSTVI